MRPVPYEGSGFGDLPTGPPRSFIIKLVLLVVFVVAAFQSISVYFESLWFASLGFEPVYWYQFKAQSAAFTAFFFPTAIILWVMFRLVIPTARGPRRQLMEVNGRPVYLPGLETARSLARPVAILAGVFLAFVFSSEWMTFALYVNRSETGSITDPILGKSLAFYFFTLPVLGIIGQWVLAMAALVMVISMVLSIADSTARFRGVSIGLCFLLAAVAFQTFLSRYDLLLEDHELFSGMNYVGEKILAPALLLTAAALVVGSLLALVNVFTGRIRNLAVAIGLPVVTYVISGILVPAYVTMFYVKPNELDREKPYIQHNIQFTRQAYDLDRIEETPFEPKLTNVTVDPVAHKATLDNVRLWDWRALQDTLRQIQEIRTYYDFPDVDVDRYTIDGKPVEMMLAAREVSLNKLPTGSRNWVNERLVYTHGYGVTMNPVSKFTHEGLPQFVLSNMPVESTRPEVKITRPEIYFGELTDWPVYVKTHQKEFNYPEGDANNYTTYEGSGGIPMNSFFRRLLLAFEMGDIAKVPFSDDIDTNSMLLYRRDIRERVRTVAPFLSFDDDPYLVVGEDGKLYWFIDAYTSSNQYPFSRHVRTQNGSLNYMRNSVKIVVDAYNGTVSMYVFDTKDPLIATYEKIFPVLFKPSTDMPDFLRKHIRYPEQMLRVQASLYTTYHVQNEQVFYNHEDVWTIAQQGRSQANAGGQTSDVIEPFYVLMAFPGEKTLEFVAILPFTPSNRNNLIGWIGARSDGDAYGKLRSYHFPKTKLVDGPLQMQARIDQNSQLSSQLTLWNQQGSKVIRGNLLIIPLNDTLLYVEPIYLQAERSPMPELRLVVLLTQDQLAYGTNFEEALKQLTEGRAAETPAAPATTSNAPGTPNAPATPAPAADVRTMVDRANQALNDYRRLTAEGKLGEAGAKLDELKRTLDELTKKR